MKITSASFIVALLFFIQTAQAQTKSQIDQFLENCLSHTEGKTTSGCAGCVRLSREKWEEEIEANYKEMMMLSTDRERQLFRSMHNSWMKYKELRFKFLNDIYGDKSEAWTVMLEEEKMKVVKNYAMEMKEVLQSVKTCHLQTDAGM